MEAELLLNDMIAVERKLERLVDERKKGGGRERSVIDREAVLFERFKDSLSREIPLREIDLTAEEEKTLAGFGFLTRKPLLVLLNLHEGQELPPVEYPHMHSNLAGLQGKLEMEIAQLPAEDVEVFMSEYGIAELGLARVIRLSYEAAGEIHSDLQKGFIRAEVILYDELISLGGLNEAKAKGRLRLEGKEYVVHDGEIVHIRFNV
jgi:ribosome-binding ATPase YchF (GTP1/OBG family)